MGFSPKEILRLVLMFVAVLCGLGLAFGWGTSELYLQWVVVVLVPLAVGGVLWLLFVMVSTGLEGVGTGIRRLGTALRSDKSTDAKQQQVPPVTDNKVVVEALDNELAKDADEPDYSSQTNALARDEMLKRLEQMAKDAMLPLAKFQLYQRRPFYDAASDELINYRKILEFLKAEEDCQEQLLDGYRRVQEVHFEFRRPYQERLYELGEKETEERLQLREKYAGESLVISLVDEELQPLKEEMQEIQDSWKSYWDALLGLDAYSELKGMAEDLKLRTEEGLQGPRSLSSTQAPGVIAYVWEMDYGFCVEYNGIAKGLLSVAREVPSDLYSTLTAEEAAEIVNESGLDESD